MAKGSYSANAYDAARAYRDKNKISDFDYHDTGATGTHKLMNPLGAMRECRDSAEHPETLPIIVWQDETGTLRDVPRIMFSKLPRLMRLLLDKGYAVGPQIMFSAVGDATCDRAPLQVGQFEADNEIDEVLRRIFLEGYGGGQQRESYELALYYMARHIRTDAQDKRRRKGYAFFIADEYPYSNVKRGEVQRIIGDTIEADIPFDDILAEVLQWWNVYYILPAGAANFRDDEILRFWQDRLGQNAFRLDDLSAICDTIGVTIGVEEGMIDLDEGLDDVDPSARTVVGKALATLGSSSGGRVVAASAPGDLDAPSGNTRL